MVDGKKTWPVVEFTLAEILKLDAGSWKRPQFAGARVPTFQQMIDLVKGKAGIIPETKAPEVYGRRGLNMEQAVMEVLKTNKLDTPGADPKTPVVIQSFSAASLKALRKDHGCKLPLVYLIGAADTTAGRAHGGEGVRRRNRPEQGRRAGPPGNGQGRPRSWHERDRVDVPFREERQVQERARRDETTSSVS